MTGMMEGISISFGDETPQGINIILDAHGVEQSIAGCNIVSTDKLIFGQGRIYDDAPPRLPLVNGDVRISGN